MLKYISIGLILGAGTALAQVQSTDVAPRAMSPSSNSPPMASPSVLPMTSQAPGMAAPGDGTIPSASQCANLLARAVSVASLRQGPDYDYCRSHASIHISPGPSRTSDAPPKAAPPDDP